MNNATIAKLCDLRSGEYLLGMMLLFFTSIHLVWKVSGEVVKLLALCHANGRFVPLKVEDANCRERETVVGKEMESDTKYDTQMLWKNEPRRSYQSDTTGNHDAGHECNARTENYF